MSLDSIIQALTGDPRERLTLLMAALLEGGNLTGPWPVGDGGRAHGPYQIHAGTTHPNITVAQANDPYFAANYALTRGFTGISFRDAIRRVPESLWRSDPFTAAAQAAYLSEGPAAMYPANRIADARRTLGGLGASLASSIAGGQFDPGPGPATPTAPIGGGGGGQSGPVETPVEGGRGLNLWRLFGGPELEGQVDKLTAQVGLSLVGAALILLGVAALVF